MKVDVSSTLASVGFRVCTDSQHGMNSLMEMDSLSFIAVRDVTSTKFIGFASALF